MKKLFYLSIAVMLIACSKPAASNNEENKEQSNDRIEQLENTIKVLRDSINLLKYPADHRLLSINKYVEEKNFAKAKEEITSLKSLFPASQEAKACDEISNKIVTLEKAAQEEADRIKALGFKALKQESDFTIDYNKVKLTNITTAARYIFDDYGHQYFYREAERGSKYVLTTMTITTENHNPQLPQLAVYSINGDKMNLCDAMDIHFSRWEDYGTYLGNGHDFRNDFSHTGTISFKLGTPVSTEILNAPYAIVCRKKNCLTRETDRYRNPPVSYSGSAGYPSELSLESFNQDYILVRLYNLK